jgi:predicted secreted hydrolase
MAYKRKGRKKVKMPPKSQEKDNRGIKILLAVIVAVVMVLVPLTVLLSTDESENDGDEPTFEIVFPKDEGQHNDSEEFWKVDLLLQNQIGNRFAINVDYYLHEAGPQQKVVTVTDEGGISGDEFFTRVYDGSLGIGYEKLNLSFESASGTDTWTGDYVIPYRYTYRGQVYDGVDEVYYLDLVMTSMKDPLLLGDEGKIFLESNGNASGTIKGYMITRLSIAGTMRFSGLTHTVTGYAWYQHLWGAWSLRDMEELRLHLSTASELFLMRFFDPQDRQVIEELVYYSKPDGEILKLTSGDFELENLRYWLDSRFPPPSIRCLPSRWSFVTTVVNTDITLHSTIPDQIEISHWEGSLSISGTIDGLVASGRGFAILNHAYFSEPKVLSFYRDDIIPTVPDLYITITNEIPMDNATVFYQVNGGNWVSSPMANVDGDLWKATISVLFDDDVIAYVDAYDLAGKKVTSDQMIWTV